MLVSMLVSVLVSVLVSMLVSVIVSVEVSVLVSVFVSVLVCVLDRLGTPGSVGFFYIELFRWWETLNRFLLMIVKSFEISIFLAALPYKISCV